MTAVSLPAPQDPLASLGRYAAGPPALAAPADTSKPRDIEELCEEFLDVAESAVDPLEIASALEFDGLSDQTVRKRYGVSDVFALAEEMYRRVPRRPPEPEPPAELWSASKLGPALHGLLYGLPTVCFPAAAGLLTGPGVLGVLIVALLVSWALSQGLAYLGYARLGRADRAQAARLLRAGLATGTGVTALAMTLAGLTLGAHVPALVFGLGVGVYMLGATVLMVLGAERQLLIVLAPGVLGSAAFLALGRPASLEHLAWAALAATPLLAVGLAVAAASRDAGPLRRRRALPPLPGQLATAAELSAALPSAGFGLAAAGLLVFPVAVGLPGEHGPHTGALIASLPLALSMGAAEWLLIWFRRRTQRLLRASHELPAFAIRARLLLLSALMQYLAVAGLLTVAVLAAATESGLLHLHPADLPQVAVYLALGGAMFLALLLQAFGSRAFPLIACVAALAFEVVGHGLGVTAQLVAGVELLVVLAGYGALVLGRATRHAC
jgi:hypothetical protein